MELLYGLYMEWVTLHSKRDRARVPLLNEVFLSADDGFLATGQFASCHTLHRQHHLRYLRAWLTFFPEASLEKKKESCYRTTSSLAIKPRVSISSNGEAPLAVRSDVRCVLLWGRSLLNRIKQGWVFMAAALSRVQLQIEFKPV